MKKGKGLILFTRLPDYFYQCLIHFTEKYHFQCIVIAYPGDEHTDFSYKSTDYITILNRKDFLVAQHIEEDYQFIYSSSWRDKDYKAVCRKYKSQIPVIIGLDNPWYGNVKQWIHVLISSVSVKPFFNRIWTAGQPQYEYAKKLGYKDSEIIKGLYSADTNKFYFQDTAFQNNLKRSILFLGRFVPYKNPVMLAKVFNEIYNEDKSIRDWNLIFTGRGPLINELKAIDNPNIDIRDFVVPEKLPDLFKEVSLFCLPSQNEHWGVVVHEAAYSGLPLLLSDTVYSGTAFLEEGVNGYFFRSGDEEDLKKKLHSLLKKSFADLQNMGAASKTKSIQITLDTWADELYATISTFK